MARIHVAGQQSGLEGGQSRIRRLGALLVGCGLGAILWAAPVVADEVKAQLASGLTQVSGSVTDPTGRVWVSDRTAGFCRVSPRTSDSPGAIEPATCLGGSGTNPTPGPTQPGAPAFVDPTPGSVGSGDEMALVPDSAEGSADVARLRWDTGSKTFQFSSVLTLHDGDLRPTGVSYGADGDAYVVLARTRAILRIVDPTDSQPEIETVAYTAAVGARAISATEVRSGSRITVYVADATSLRSFVPPSQGSVSSQVPTASYAIGSAPALTYDPQTNMLFGGTATATQSGADLVKRVDTGTGAITSPWASGFTRIGGLSLIDGKLLVADDAGLLNSANPTGTGSLYVTGEGVVRITSGPTNAAGNPAPDPTRTNDSTPIFTFVSEPVAAMQCSLRPAGSGPVWATCSGLYTPESALADGNYTFGVRAGTVVPPAFRDFSVDTVAPAAPAIAAPTAGQVVPHLVVLSVLSAVETTLQCSLDGAAFASCRSGDTLTLTTDGNHTLRVTAQDAAGNASPVSQVGFVADLLAPDLTITAPATDGATIGENPTIAFSSASTDVTGYRCRIDAGAFAACTSPASYPGLALGNHTFEVEATDRVGNQTPRTRTFVVVDSTPPVVSSSPPAGTYNSGQLITLSGDEPADIFFTTDGTTPTTASSKYSSPLTLTSTMTLRFFGVDTRGNASAVVEVAYAVFRDTTPPVVSASPVGGVYGPGRTVTLSANEAATIYFTTDGTQPTTLSSKYSAPIPMTSGLTLTFFGVDTAGNPSNTAAEIYTLDTTPPVVSVSLPSGEYVSGHLVELSANEAATIYFTTDGSDPSTLSTKYLAPIPLTANMTLRFFGLDAFGNASTAESRTYTIQDTTPPVVWASPASGVYGPGQLVELSANEAATIYFTTDGSDPSTLSTKYLAPIPLTANMTLKFFGVDGNGNASGESAETYVLDSTPPVITASPAGGTVISGQLVELSANEAATIYFTTDGSDPTTSSVKYATPIAITQATTLKFFGVDAVGNEAATSTQSYVVDADAPVVTPSPGGGEYPVGQLIELSTEAGASIYYTTNGSAPTTASAKYTAPITLTAPMTLKFFAVDALGNASAVVSEMYTIRDTTAPVVAVSPAGGQYGSGEVITLSANEAAAIFYTTDGSQPSTSSTKYTVPLTLTAPMTLKYFGIDAAGNTSVVATQVYTIAPLSASQAHDFTGDKVSDVLARDGAGSLWVYPGDGSGGFRTRALLGTGWSSRNVIVAPGDFDSDGCSDVIARDTSGRLWLSRGNCASGLASATRIGTGWGGLLIAAPGDFNGDGRVDLIARGSSGVLYLYPGNGSGGFGSRAQIGTGWGIMNLVFGPGDFNGDGRVDLIARDSSGVLYLYPGNGSGGFGSRAQIGTGWGSFTVFGPGDFNGDGNVDVLARDSSGRLWLYPGDGSSVLGGRVQVGTGWSEMLLA